MSDCSGRCTGHCCQNFGMSWSPDELREAYQRWHAQRDGGIGIAKAGVSCGLYPVDIHLIYPMVIYLGDEAPIPEQINGPSFEGYRYRCKHWDAETGDCTIYDIRPQMCRDYPGEAGCNYAACTWRSRRQTPR